MSLTAERGRAAIVGGGARRAVIPKDEAQSHVVRDQIYVNRQTLSRLQGRLTVSRFQRWDNMRSSEPTVSGF